MNRSRVRKMELAQGLIFLTAGLWPVFHIKSFEKVTGPKVDDWLVKTVGPLLAVTGATLLYTSARPPRSREAHQILATVAGGHAMVLCLVSLIYASKGRISRIYLLDTLMELGIVSSWLSLRKEFKKPLAA